MSQTVILARHAEYTPSGSDPEVSFVGKLQSEYLANAIEAALGKGAEITLWTSAARRARGTAEVLERRLNPSETVVHEKLWSDNSHRHDFPWLKEQLDAFDGENLVIISHLEYVQDFPEYLGYRRNHASYTQGVIMNEGECIDFLP